MKMNSHIIKRYLVAVMAPLCSVPILCSAVVIEGFESGVNGWGSAAAASATVTLSASTLGCIKVLFIPWLDAFWVVICHAFER